MKVSAAHVPSKVLRGNLPSSSFSGFLSRRALRLHIVSVSLSSLLYLLRTLVIGVRATRML